MSIATWMAVLKTNMQAVSGINTVYLYSDLPASIKRYPALTIIPTGVSQEEYSLGGPNRSYWDVTMTLYTTTEVLPKSFSKAVPFIESIRNALAADIQLGSTVEYCLPAEPFVDGPGGITYADQILLGINFYLNVKVNNDGAFTVSA